MWWHLLNVASSARCPELLDGSQTVRRNRVPTAVNHRRMNGCKRRRYKAVDSVRRGPTGTGQRADSAYLIGSVFREVHRRIEDDRIRVLSAAESKRAPDKITQVCHRVAACLATQRFNTSEYLTDCL